MDAYKVDGEPVNAELVDGIGLRIDGTIYNFVQDSHGYFAVCNLADGASLRGQTCGITIIPGRMNPTIQARLHQV